MKNQRKVVQALDATELQEVTTAINLLLEKLGPYMAEMGKSEKKRMSALKDKSLSFVQKTYEHSTQNPFMIPAFVEPEEMKNEMATMEVIRQLINPLVRVVNGLEDTNFIIGNDAYNSALAMYQMVKTASKNNVPGATQIYEDLKVRFETQGRKKATKEPTKAA